MREFVPLAFSTPHTRGQATGAADRFAHSAGPGLGLAGQKDRRGLVSWRPHGGKNGPRGLQNGPKITPRRLQNCPEGGPEGLLGPFWALLGLLGAILRTPGAILGHIPARTYTDLHRPTGTCTYPQTHIPTYLHTYLHTYVHTCVHAYIHMCMYVCIYLSI